MVAAGRASQELGGKIADRLGVQLTDAGLKTFTDGEVYCRYEESIRGADIFIVQSIVGNDQHDMDVNDALMELLVMIEAAVGASAHRVIAVTPWYGYSRQDKKSAPREPITARLVAKMLEVAGIDRLLTMDLHAGQVQGFFSKPVDHMTAMPILTQYVQDNLPSDNLVIISPDAGRVKLTRKFAQKIGAPYALLEKERPAQQVAEIGYVIGDVKGKTAVIVDDIIDTGGTLVRRRADRDRRGRQGGLRRRHPRHLLGQRLRDAGGVAARRHPRDRHGPAARRRARPDPPADERGHPDRLGPPDLHGRLRVSEIFAGENQLF